MPDTNDLKSHKLTASLLKKDEYGGIKRVLSFQPTGRAESVADALVAATKEHKEEGKVIQVDLKHTEVDYGNGLFLNIAYISSDAVCQTCGATRANPTEWCDDPGSEKKGGCGKFREEPVTEKAPKADLSEQMRKMASLME